METHRVVSVTFMPGIAASHTPTASVIEAVEIGHVQPKIMRLRIKRDALIADMLAAISAEIGVLPQSCIVTDVYKNKV